MTITIRLKTGNAAFSSDYQDPDSAKAQEVRRIVQKWLARCDFDPGRHTLLDYNGNTVGSVTVTGR